MDRYRDTLEQATRAEALGFESVWPVEQHFHQAQSALPCPAILLAAIAARTRTLRLGTAVVQLPLSHPLRVAEEMATLDVLSNGRVELGVGRGSNPKHFAGFGVPMTESRDRMVEAIDFLRLAFTEERFSFQGRFFQANEVCLVPKPVQRPGPTIRIAANSVESFELAGRAGLPLIVAAHINPFPRLRELFAVYHRARAEAGHPAAGGDDVTLLMPFYVGESRNQIRQDMEPAVRHYVDMLSSLLASGAGKWASEAESKSMNALLEKVRAVTYETMNESSAVFDTPEACVDRLRRIREDFGVGRVITWFNFVGAISHEKVLRSMELFSSRVMPHV